MNRPRAALFSVTAIVVALLGTAAVGSAAVPSASTVTWTLANTGLPAAGIVRDVAFGDVDNDGMPDLVAAFTGAPGLAIYGGNGVGVWSTAGYTTGLPATGSYEHLAVSDLNGDGKADIFASRGANAGLNVWQGNGSGSWTAPATGLTTTGTFAGVAVGDVNRDGRLDLIAAGNASGASGVRVYANNWPNFTPITSAATTGVFNDVAVAFVNEDAYLDLAATGSVGVYFWKGAAAANWTAARTGLPTTGVYRGLALGDLDNDSWPELVAGRGGFAPTGGGLSIYRWNEGAGSWSGDIAQISTADSFGRIELRDVNNDGWLDVLAAGYPQESGQGLAVWLGGATGFTVAASPAMTSSLGSIAAADFDRDGLLDIAAGDAGNGGVLAWRSDGVQQVLDDWLALPTPLDNGSPLSVGRGDLDRDGFLDVVLPAAAGGLDAWQGDGGNAWEICPGLAKAVPTGAFGDIVMDVYPQVGQDPTIIAARTDNGGIVMVHGADCYGGGGKSTITTTGSYRGLSAGDVFHEGVLNVVAAPSLSKGGLQLWELLPGGWHLGGTLAVSATIRDTALGDVDHDGLLEIATADSGGDGVTLYDYAARAWVSHTVAAGGVFYAVALGDINNDGNLDIAAGRNGAETGIGIWLGAGAPDGWTFHDGPDAADPVACDSLELADYNYDGHLDLLAATNGSGLRLWQGNGAGVWTASGVALPSDGHFLSARFGHIDRDGNLDILATEDGKGLRLWSASDAAGPTITPFRSSLWISTTQSPTLTAHILDAGSGVSVTSAYYRYSTDGGSTWAGWLPAPMTGADGSTSQQTIATSAVPFSQDSQTRNVVGFIASDMAGNMSTVESTIWIDTAPPVPASLFSYDRDPGSWSTNPNITVTFGVSDATSGWASARVEFDTSSSTLPPAVANTGANIHYTAGPLADGAWYAHLRGVDVAGNWSPTALHLGPLGIDTTPPVNPTYLASTDHQKSVWSNDQSIDMHWLGATDAGSGVSGYSYLWDTLPGTLPDTVTETVANTMTGWRTTGSSHWFHLRTRDAVGNWSSNAVHAGPYYIDATAPTSAASSPASSADTHFWVTWAGADANSGIASYDIQVRNRTLGGAWTDWLTGQTDLQGSYTGQGGNFYEFRSRARDNAGNVEAYSSSADTTTGVATVDLSIKTFGAGSPAIEVNQSVQDLNNSVPLMQWKRTFVRCYVQSDASSFKYVKARLKVYSNDVYQGTVGPLNAGATITVTTDPIRSVLHDAFLFDVPSLYLKQGTARFECEINYDHKYAESSYANNIASVTLGVNPGRVLNVEMVDIRFWAADGLHQVRNEDRWRLEAWLEAAYPIQWVNASWSRFTEDYESEPALSDVLADLRANIGDVDEALSVHHYGMLYVPASRTGTIGLGNRPGLAAAGFTAPSAVGDGTWGEEIGGHEIGHNVGRTHVHCSGTEDENDQEIDLFYPYDVRYISPSLDAWGATSAYGIDGSTSPPRIISPMTADLMSYCTPQWVSPYTYMGLWSFIPAASARTDTLTSPSSAVDRLLVSGSVVTPTQAVTLGAFFHVTSATDMPGRDAGGPYSIRFFDQGGGLLQNYPFSPTWEEFPGTAGAINERVPWISATAQIAIWRGEQALITRTVSAHSPEVSLTSPNGGETLSGDSAAASWTASDGDPGNTLTYRLDFSRDAGVTWQAITGALHHLTATLDLSILPGTTQGKLRVRVSDGVNVASDATDGVFTVTKKLPEIVHLEPASGATYIVSQTVNLRGGAFDAEDNLLTDDRLAWTSSLMGSLGTGRLLQLVDLIAGTHTITLTATDSDGNAVTATTVIVIEEPHDHYQIYLPMVSRQALAQ